MKILLISPGTADEIDNKIIRQIPYLYARAFNAPHAVATVAALTPAEHEVSIHDEHMRGPSDLLVQSEKFDIIGISVTSNQLERSLEIASNCRKSCPGALIVAGGIGVETLIHNKKADFDVIFSGEAEETWPQFLEDFKAGQHKAAYKTVSKPDLTKAPAPRWDLIQKDLKYYNSVLVQTTRGCPHDCSFCDVIYVYGRKPRSKTIEQVLEEIRRIEKMGIMMVFIADDNFTGDKRYVKALLRELIKLNNSFRMPLGYFTQLDIGIAEDDELLQLLADANFYTLMIGVESISPESLKDLNKKQNLGINLVDAIKKIQSYGMVVLTHMIIGADSDDRGVFERTAGFIQEAQIVFHICHPLAAPPGTRLWYDLKRAGRIVHIDRKDTHDQFDILSNIVPAKMSRTELFEGLADYWEKIYDPALFIERAKGFLKGITKKPNVKVPALLSMWRMRKMINRVLWYFLFEAGKEHRKGFFSLIRSSWRDASYLIPKIIYVYSFYLIDLWRSQYDAAIAREHAAWERENPQMIVLENAEVPVSDTFRSVAQTVISAAFQRVREKVHNKEQLYDTVLKAVSEFNDRHGETIGEFNEYYMDQIHVSCDRITEKLVSSSTVDEIPETPYVGFVREIVDAMDSRKRNDAL